MALTGGTADPLRGGEIAPQQQQIAQLNNLTVNVTQLTKARLETVLQQADEWASNILCLQETRHAEGGYAWAARAARTQGWYTQWSEAPPLDRLGRRQPGGTAIMWRKEMGKGTKIETTSHRACVRVWEQCALASVYGDANKADMHWALEVTRQVEEQTQAVKMVIGDWNWRPCYISLFAEGWRTAPAVASTLSGPAAPTRCIFMGGSQDDEVDVKVAPLPGVPHHCALGYNIPCSSLGRKADTRLRRTAAYQWHGKLGNDQ